MIEVDRSRIIAYQRCPRERYLAYHHLGKGLQKRAKALPLVVGSAFHEGAEELLRGDVETAVYRAVKFLVDAFKGKGVGFDGESVTDQSAAYSAQEQVALAEAMIRAWGAEKLGEFLDQFEVIEVEQEGRARLTHDLTLMFRPDALIREKLSGDNYVVSWKTAATYSTDPYNGTYAQCRHDMQSMSEVWGLQNRLCEDEGCDHYGTKHGCNNPKIEGVLYLFLIKGYRKKDEWDGIRKQNTNLIYGWKKLKAGEGEEEWSWTFKWSKEDGSGNSTLGKGWKKVPVWSEYPGGVKAWIEGLHSRSIFPRHLDPFEGVFPQFLPVERRADEVAKWKLQTVAQELRVANNLEMVSDEIDLDEYFPQYTHSCHAYSGCQFIDICHGGVEAGEGELYTIRTANHPESGEDEE